MTEMLSGGDMLIRALQDEGVEYVFGYPGGAALHIYDAIFRQQEVVRRLLELRGAQVLGSVDTVANAFLVRIPDSRQSSNNCGMS